MTSRRNLKNPHAEIICTVSLARHHTTGNAFGRVFVKIGWRD
jgi:hypothetical protein